MLWHKDIQVMRIQGTWTLQFLIDQGIELLLYLLCFALLPDFIEAREVKPILCLILLCSLAVVEHGPSILGLELNKYDFGVVSQKHEARDLVALLQCVLRQELWNLVHQINWFLLLWSSSAFMVTFLIVF